MNETDRMHSKELSSPSWSRTIEFSSVPIDMLNEWDAVVSIAVHVAENDSSRLALVLDSETYHFIRMHCHLLPAVPSLSPRQQSNRWTLHKSSPRHLWPGTECASSLNGQKLDNFVLPWIILLVSAVHGTLIYGSIIMGQSRTQRTIAQATKGHFNKWNTSNVKILGHSCQLQSKGWVNGNVFSRFLPLPRRYHKSAYSTNSPLT